MMTNYCSALEAILFAAGEPVPVSRISLVLGIPEEKERSAVRKKSR